MTKEKKMTNSEWLEIRRQEEIDKLTEANTSLRSTISGLKHRIVELENVVESKEKDG